MRKTFVHTNKYTPGILIDTIYVGRKKFYKIEWTQYNIVLMGRQTNFSRVLKATDCTLVREKSHLREWVDKQISRFKNE